jgi:hypothetical protein
MSSYKEENRKRLIRLLADVKFDRSPKGRSHVTSIAVGGLLNVGYSKVQTNLLLVVSSSGRGLIDSANGEKIERDYKEYEGLDDWDLSCKGIGILKKEAIPISGPNGGGLPQSNSAGETLAVVSPNWPEQDLILCKEHKCALIEGHQDYCSVIYSEHIRGFGFSWCGNYIVAACGSDLDLWQRIKKL